MSTTPSPATTRTLGQTRFRLFFDFWNFQLTLNEHEAKASGVRNARFPIDWTSLPQRVVQEAAQVVGASSYSYEGSLVFASYNPKASEDKKFHKWIAGWLDRQPGIQVICYERRPRKEPRCPACQQLVPRCPHCGENLRGTSEKGVDTAIATDMIRLAWEGAYEVAVLASSDADLVPAVQFLDQKGFKVIQAGFPPHGSYLSKACWATIDMFAMRQDFRRR